MKRKIISVGRTTSVNKAASVMAETGVGSVVVMEDDRALGIVTERDVMTRCCAKNLDCNALKVSDIMSSPLVTVVADANLSQIMELMLQNEVRRLLVADKGKIVGIVAQRDLTEELFNVFTSLMNLSTLP